VPGDPLPWLYGVAFRTLANQRGSERRSAALTERLIERRDAPSPPIPGFDSDPDLDPQVERALDTLSTVEREAVLLIAWEGLTARWPPGRRSSPPGAPVQAAAG
jgi:RNA polymerase sigma-70 factor (ECF subfamily)